jgi:hypothetical protein
MDSPPSLDLFYVFSCIITVSGLSRNSWFVAFRRAGRRAGLRGPCVYAILALLHRSVRVEKVKEVLQHMPRD